MQKRPLSLDRFARRGLLAMAFVLVCAPSAWCVDFTGSIDEAHGGDDQNRPMVVHFRADWCGWCRKMKVNTFNDERVNALEKKFLWVAVDVDERKELAARFQVFGVPQTIVLDSTGKLLAARGGYIPADAFIDFLNSALTGPAPQIDSLNDLLDSVQEMQPGEELDQTVTELVERLARPERSERRQILAAFVQRGPDVWPRLWEKTGDERLSVRAAAAVALNHTTKANLPFQPFAAASVRQEQRAAWSEWIDAHRPVQSVAPTTTAEPNE